MLDRTIPPLVRDIDSLVFPHVDKVVLSNGIPLYIIDRGEQPLSRLDILFTSGRANAVHPLAAEFTVNMLREGAAGKSSAEIAESLDYFGVTLQTMASMRNTYITLYSANSYFFDVLPILRDLILHPTFPEAEFVTQRDRARQSLLVELEKVSTLAGRAFASQMFGADHPYGRMPELVDYETLTIDHLRAYHAEHYVAGRCRLVLSGRITPEMVDLLVDLFSEMPSTAVSPLVLPPFSPADSHYSFVSKSGALQSGIRVSRFVVGRNHPHHHALRVLNTILGGYFGSRLMSNIREDKGYTYGIQSTVIAFPDAAYLTIHTQTAVEYVAPLLREVRAELSRLRHELVSSDELHMVRSYMIGEILRLFDTPISVAEVFVSLLAAELDFEYYAARFEVIRTITSDGLRDLAQQYFSPDDFYTVVAGAEK